MAKIASTTYSDIINYPSVCEFLKNHVSKNEMFTIKSIPLNSLFNIIKLFVENSTNFQSKMSQDFITMLNRNCSNLTATLVDQISNKAHSQLYSIRLKFNSNFVNNKDALSSKINFVNKSIINEISYATRLAKKLVTTHVQIQASQPECATYYLSVPLNFMIAAISVQDYNFKPYWNSSYYEHLFSYALMLTGHKHDFQDEKMNQLEKQITPPSKHKNEEIHHKLSAPDFPTNKLNLPPLDHRRVSTSIISSKRSSFQTSKGDSFTDEEMTQFHQTNLNLLKTSGDNSTYQNPQPGSSSIALLNMMSLLGFTVNNEEIPNSKLTATISFENMRDQLLQIKFEYQITSKPRRKLSHI